MGDDEEEPLIEDDVVRLARAVLNRTPETPVLVRADNAVPYGRVVTGMVLLQNAGAARVGFVTDPPEFADEPPR